jgi:hypothetical protein
VQLTGNESLETPDSPSTDPDCPVAPATMEVIREGALSVTKNIEGIANDGKCQQVWTVSRFSKFHRKEKKRTGHPSHRASNQAKIERCPERLCNAFGERLGNVEGKSPGERQQAQHTQNFVEEGKQHSLPRNQEPHQGHRIQIETQRKVLPQPANLPSRELDLRSKI